MAEFDQAKSDSYQLSDAELTRLNELTATFVSNVQQEFGSRTTQAMVNMIGSQLSHVMLAYDQAFYIMDRINDWFHVAARVYGGLPFRIKFDAEPVRELGAE